MSLQQTRAPAFTMEQRPRLWIMHVCVGAWFGRLLAAQGPLPLTGEEYAMAARHARMSCWRGMGNPPTDQGSLHCLKPCEPDSGLRRKCTLTDKVCKHPLARTVRAISQTPCRTSCGLLIVHVPPTCGCTPQPRLRDRRLSLVAGAALVNLYQGACAG